jgi:hypothetical protein
MLSVVRSLASAGLALMLLGSCAPLQLASKQKNPDYTGPQLKHIMVIGITTDARVRQAFENSVVAKLKAAGVAAIPSYPLIPKQDALARARMLEIAKGAGVDGVLIARIDKAEQQGGPMMGINFADRTTDFNEVESGGGEATFDPSLAGPSAFITVTYNLYSMEGLVKVWSGVTEQMPTNNLFDASAGYVQIVVKALTEQKLI